MAVLPIIILLKMGGNKQVFTELPKPIFTTPKAECPDEVKDDMFIKTFKEAVDAGIKSAEAEMYSP